MKKTMMFGLIALMVLVLSTTALAVDSYLSLPWETVRNDYSTGLDSFNDGQYLVLDANNPMYVSDDYGATWQLTPWTGGHGALFSNNGKIGYIWASDDTNEYRVDDVFNFSSTPTVLSMWIVADASSNGSIVLGRHNTDIQVSYDGGATFTTHTIGSYIFAEDMSPNGQYMVAAERDTQKIYYSDNYGVNWTTKNIPYTINPRRIAISDDGQKILIGDDNDAGDGLSVVLSLDAGDSWTEFSEEYTGLYHEYVTGGYVGMSGDGSIMGYPQIYPTMLVSISTDGGSTFTTSKARDEQSLFELVVTSNGSYVYLATDQGLFRVDPTASVANWTCGTFTCQINDTAVCTEAIDTFGGPYNFTGDLSVFGTTSCDYCTPEWICGGWPDCNGTAPVDCVLAVDTNTCYAQTGLLSDFFNGNVSSLSQKSCEAVSSSSSGGGGSSIGSVAVDADGNVVGVVGLVPVQQAEEPEAPFLSIGGGEPFNFKVWVSNLWATIKGWFVQ